MSDQQFSRSVPPGDTHERAVCDRCGFIDYENPRVVVGSVVTSGNRILMCRRAIEPRSGFWTLPAGFLEKHELPEDGARREAMEEACAEIAINDLLAVYAIARISQIQLIYRSRLIGDAFAAGPESTEVALYEWNEIPWDDIAFPSVHWALRDYDSLRHVSAFAPRGNPEGATGDL